MRHAHIPLLALLFYACLSIPVLVSASDSRPLIDITYVQVSPKNAYPGDLITVYVNYKNKGGSGKAYIGASLYHPSLRYPCNTPKYCNLPWKEISTSKGSSGTIKIYARIPSNAPPGSYSILVCSWDKCWKGCENSPCYCDGCCDGKQNCYSRSNVLSIGVCDASTFFKKGYRKVKTYDVTDKVRQVEGEKVEKAILYVYYNKYPMDYWRYGKSKPPARSVKDMVLGWKKGYELTRIKCGDFWYWVKWKARLEVKHKKTENRASITSFNPSSGTFRPGDSITAKVTVKNTGTTTRSFWVGLSYRKPDGSWYDVPPKQTRTLSPGEITTVTFSYTLPSDAPEGWYDAVTAVWNGYDSYRNKMIEPRFDSEERSDAFKVEKPKLKIRVWTNRATLEVGEELKFGGKVTDDEGNPVGDAKVLIYNPFTWGWYYTWTESNGEFSYSIYPDETGTFTFKFKAEREGYTSSDEVRHTVIVKEHENRPPKISKVYPSESTIEVRVGETVEFRVRVEDPDGNLDRVVWFVNGKDVATHHVSGSSDTDSFSHTFTEGEDVVAIVYDKDQNSQSTKWSIWVSVPLPMPHASPTPTITPQTQTSTTWIGIVYRPIVIKVESYSESKGIPNVEVYQVVSKDFEDIIKCVLPTIEKETFKKVTEKVTLEGLIELGLIKEGSRLLKIIKGVGWFSAAITAADLIDCVRIPKEIPIGKTNSSGILVAHVPIAEFKFDSAKGKVVDFRKLSNTVKFKVGCSEKEIKFEEDLSLLKNEVEAKVMGIDPTILDVPIPSYEVKFKTEICEFPTIWTSPTVMKVKVLSEKTGRELSFVPVFIDNNFVGRTEFGELKIKKVDVEGLTGKHRITVGDDIYYVPVSTEIDFTNPPRTLTFRVEEKMKPPIPSSVVILYEDEQHTYLVDALENYFRCRGVKVESWFISPYTPYRFGNPDWRIFIIPRIGYIDTKYGVIQPELFATLIKSGNGWKIFKYETKQTKIDNFYIKATSDEGYDEALTVFLQDVDKEIKKLVGTNPLPHIDSEKREKTNTDKNTIKIKEIFPLLDAYFSNEPVSSLGRVPTVKDIFNKLDEYFGG